MDQESNSKSSSRGSWRDRLGITDDGTSKSEAGSSSAAAPSTKPAPVGGPKVVAKPAPMAPRPGAAAKAPVRAAPATADQATSPAKPKPEAERPQAAAGQKDDAFAERLRQHRAAAEEAVKKRSASPGLEKFSFAKKEVETARAESAPSSKPVSPNRPAPANKAAAPAARPAAPVRTAVSSPAQTGSAAQRPAVPQQRPVQLQPVRAPGVAAAPRPAQYGAPQSSHGQPSHGQPSHAQPSHGQPSHGQPPYRQPQQPSPAYRPAGPGYAAPSGPRQQPPQGYAPQGADPYGRGGYPAPRPPAPQAPQAPLAAPGQGQRFAPPASEFDLFEDNGYRPAAPLGRAAPLPARNEPLRPEFDEPFDDRREYGGRTANDYSQAYREYDDDDYEEDEPRRWGGLVMVVLALVTIGAIAAGLIYWYTQQKTSTTAGTGQVPVVSAPANPAKAQPDGDTNQSASAPAQGKKLIYDRILGSGTTSEPERIVPRQETPQAPDSNTGDDNLLPLPLPPPPQIQGSLTPGNTGPDPAQQTASAARDNLEYQGAAGSEPAASAVSTPQPTPQVDQGSINRPPVPRRKPRNLVASVQQAPTTQFQPVLQPAPAPAPALTAEQQLNAPIDLQQQAAIINPQTQAPANNQFAAPAPQLPQTRTVARDDDPLSGLRAPLNSPGQSAQQAPQALQQQRTAVVTPQPFAAPAPQQPVTSQSLQSFSPPPASQNQVASPPVGSGYVVQLAAYRSEQEALGQYQQLRSRHGNIIGDLPPSVQQTNLGASGTFYRLGMGPMASKQAATELCNKLISAGERDCLVRRR